jgi:sugar/nucleoside kinase (ribokinase family)
MSKIAILAHVVIDEILSANIDRTVVEVGGAGAYAAVGASVAGIRDSAVIVSGVGSSDKPGLSAWFNEREVDAAGLFTVGESSPRTRIRYFADGDRAETPVFGIDHFNAHTPLPEHIPYFADELGGVYLFHDHDAEYWRSVGRFRQGFSGPVMWEISRDSCRSELWSVVRERLDLVDIFSINRAETRELFGTSDLATIGLLRNSGVTTVLRCGADGSIVIDGDRVVEVGSVTVDAVDPTGAGNSYSGAFLSGFAATGDGVAAARCAAATAAAIVAQHGAPLVGPALRNQVAAAGAHVTAIHH